MIVSYYSDYGRVGTYSATLDPIKGVSMLFATTEGRCLVAHHNTQTLCLAPLAVLAPFGRYGPIQRRQNIRAVSRVDDHAVSRGSGKLDGRISAHVLEPQLARISIAHVPDMCAVRGCTAPKGVILKKKLHDGLIGAWRP